MPSAPLWLDTLLDHVAQAMEAHSVLGPLGYRYLEEPEGEFWAIQIYPTVVELRGGPEDGTLIAPGFSLDLKSLLEAFEDVVAVSWVAQPFGPDDTDNPSVSIEGRYQGQAVYLQLLTEAPEDEPPGLTVDLPAPDPGGLH